MLKLPRPLLAVLIATALALFAATPAAFAYGSNDNWQLTFSGTGTAPSTGFGFGFWGWCALGGGVTSGNDGDCQLAQYIHTPAGSGFTCHESLDITSWDTTSGTFVISGTATVTPTNLTAPCVALFPGSTNFSGVDTGFPVAPGHHNFGSLGPGLVGTFQVQETLIPSK
ncbi:MAG TPA: hypothetical protein VF116_09715 [Ktedonobacterales bacterium]